MALQPTARDSASIRLHHRTRTTTLVPGLNHEEIAEGTVLFEVQCATAANVLFDDQSVAVVRTEDGRTAFGQLDLTNQVGFHRFTVLAQSGEPISFDFHTMTAKATLAEVESMAKVVGSQVFSFKRQFVYVDANEHRRVVLLPEVAFGWMRERLGELLRLVRAVDARPATESRARYSTSHRACRVSISRTLRLLRERPALLEPRPDGPLEVDGIRFWPAAVVIRERTEEPARVEHLQLAYLLARIAKVLLQLKSHASVDVLAWQKDIASARSLRVVRQHDVLNSNVAWTSLPTQIQKTDVRYRRLRELHTEFFQEVDVADYSVGSVRANVRDAWEIYQAFATHMVGRAFGLHYSSRRCDLRERRADGASMWSPEYELFYDCRPPASVLSSWRDRSTRPADERPDVVIRRIADGAVAVMDVKFKVDRGGAVQPEDLFEMQGYLNSFALRAGGILFPGNPGARFHEGRGTLLAELPLRASSFIADSAKALGVLRADIERLFALPGAGLQASRRQ